MILQKKNNTLVPLTADTGSGAPLGDYVFAHCSNLKTIYVGKNFEQTLLKGKIRKKTQIKVK